MMGYLCGGGCCPGCGLCSGMGIGCHQVPCRCAVACTCVVGEDDYIRAGCARHDTATDRRCRAWVPDGAWAFAKADGTVERGHYQRPCRRQAKEGAVHYCHWHKPEEGA